MPADPLTLKGSAGKLDGFPQTVPDDLPQLCFVFTKRIDKQEFVADTDLQKIKIFV
ncbi:hypothetical protein DEHRE_10575 [Dehalobacter restrictus DSM 9455]|uniref:Uncharacterized protein n=1 Tax=Dehalobacter restrictus (strain DSM 9455 / PER-K23) TaxID=871738 RepID=A0ABM5P9A8_DEHRP|nr:hypothetical protein DEHRE_10575 [Dehalobacter restrictus DSM 9455]